MVYLYFLTKVEVRYFKFEVASKVYGSVELLDQRTSNNSQDKN